jgi:hypothetical protein
MFFSDSQLLLSMIVVGLAGAVATAFVFVREHRWRRLVHTWGARLLCVLALGALWSWTNFGEFHSIYIDDSVAQAGSPRRPKHEVKLPFHFHEFFHYYLGAKYFGEIGYGGLYDCTALADAEIAREDGVPPKIGGYIRNLDDVLLDKTYQEALTHCREEIVPRFTPEKWIAFKNDQRELRRLVPDHWWSGATYDAGFNPPPSWCVLGGVFAHAIPIRVGTAGTYLVATSLDVLLLIACFFVLRSAFGGGTAAMAAIFFGASFIASYGWNGGAFLRYTWITAVVFGMVATRRGKWALAGALFGIAACDRIFPMGFAIGAALPLALRAMKHQEERKKLQQFGMGLGGAVAGLVVVSSLVFGISAWGTFFERILKHGDVYYVMHIGLKKVLAWREWVPRQNFHQHEGLARFHDWNVHLRATWKSERFVAIPIQLAAAFAAAWAGAGRKPYESALIVGVCAMFFFEIPANYYYVVLALVPAILLRAAAVAPTPERRRSEYAAMIIFFAFWMFTLRSSRMWGDDIVYNHWICVALLVFLDVWLLAWIETPARLRQIQARA